MLVLTKKILAATPDGFCSFMVCGRRGIGKSVYSVIAVYGVYRELGYSESEAWRLALNSIKFSIKEVVEYLEEATNNNIKHLALVWDDVRVHAGGSSYHLNMKLVSRLVGVLDTVRTALNCLILTCPSPKGLLSVLQSYDDYLIKIRYAEKGGWYRQSTGYLWSTLPSGKKVIYKKFVDTYMCRLPNVIYAQYMDVRKQALKDALSKLKEVKDID